jgi:hypothetical protein
MSNILTANSVKYSILVFGSFKCTPQQARVEIKTLLKPANKPKGKVTKVTVPSVTNTADTVYQQYIVCFHAADHIFNILWACYSLIACDQTVGN